MTGLAKRSDWNCRSYERPVGTSFTPPSSSRTARTGLSGIRTRTQLAVAGMDSGCESLAGGDPFEQALELRTFVRAEPGAQVLFVVRNDRGKLVAQEPGTGPGQVQGMVATVLGIAATLDQPTRF